jgi:Tfp pilus assembly protein FimT
MRSDLLPTRFFSRRSHAQHGKRRFAPRRAFSMIELGIVVLIMSILAAVSAPAFLDSLLYHRVETAARRVKADLNYARQRARLTSTSQTVTFTGGSYTLVGAKSMENPSNAYTVNLQKSPYSLDTVTASFANAQTITFDGYGAPASGGTVLLGAKTHTATITVDANGAVAIVSSQPSGTAAMVTGN